MRVSQVSSQTSSLVLLSLLSQAFASPIGPVQPGPSVALAQPTPLSKITPSTIAPVTEENAETIHKVADELDDRQVKAPLLIRVPFEMPHDIDISYDSISHNLNDYNQDADPHMHSSSLGLDDDTLKSRKRQHRHDDDGPGDSPSEHDSYLKLGEDDWEVKREKPEPKRDSTPTLVTSFVPVKAPAPDSKPVVAELLVKKDSRKKRAQRKPIDKGPQEHQMEKMLDERDPPKPEPRGNLDDVLQEYGVSEPQESEPVAEDGHDFPLPSHQSKDDECVICDGSPIYHSVMTDLNDKIKA